MPSFSARTTLTTLAAAVAACFPLISGAVPQGAHVLAGQVSMVQTGKVLNITNSPGAIINWQSFNIDRGELTRFIQQSAQSQVLNRVTGGDPSQILGALQSNGRVLLINPNGVLFSRDARVDVAGLLVSTLQLSDADFLSGKWRFTGSDGAGAIRNAGELKTADGGAVILIAPQIENSGLIHTPEGDILLAAGQQVSIVDPDHPAIQVEVANRTGEAHNLGQLIASRVSIFGGLIRNTGLVEATTAVRGKNGRITLRADSRIDSQGTLQANGNRGGEIVLTADQGHLALSGQVSAVGQGTKEVLSGDGLGGLIDARARTIAVDGQLDASGTLGGGAILLGGDYQGGASGLPNPWRENAALAGNTADTTRPVADSLQISKASQLRADANTQGNGGVIVAWANGQTSAAGALSAQGGQAGGNGGLIEVSGKTRLDYQAVANTRAAQGQHGTLLLDPGALRVVANDQNTSSADPNLSVMNAATVEASLASNNLVLQADNDVAINANLAWTTSHTLTLKSGNTLSINGALTIAGNTGGLVLHYGAGTYTLGPLGRIDLSGSNAGLTVNGQNYTVLRSWTGATPMGSGGYYALASDVDASGFRGYLTNFSGVFDGLGHTISNLSIDQPSIERIGLFGTLSGSVRNLQLSNVAMRSKSHLGGIAGVMTSSGSITNVQVQGTLSGIGYNGGAVDYRGGLVGYNQGGRISDSFADVTILGDDRLGGIAGYSDGVIERSGAVVKLALHPTSQPYYGWVGGLVGEHGDGGRIFDSYALGTASGGTSGSLGGLVGLNRSLASIRSSFADVTIQPLPGDNRSGGLVGYNETGGIVTSSYWNKARYGTSSGGTGLLAEALTDLASYVGWNLSNDVAANSVWYSNGSSAPMLRNLSSSNRWTGASSDSQWASAGNWTLQHVPQAWESARIGITDSGIVITVNGEQAAKTLNTSSAVRIAENSTLKLADNSEFNDGLRMAAGTASLQQTTGLLKLRGDTQALALNGQVSAPAIALTTTSSATLSQSASGQLTTADLSLDVANDATLSGNQNRIDRIHGRAGQISLSNQGNLKVDDLTAQTVLIQTAGQLAINGTVNFGLPAVLADAISDSPNALRTPLPQPTSLTLIAGGDLQLGGTIQGSGDAYLVAGQNFNASSGTITLGDHQRWLVYSGSPGQDDAGSLAANFRHFGLGYDPLLTYAGPGQGNGFIYRDPLIAHIVSPAINKIYDGGRSAPISAPLLSLSGAGTSSLNATYTYESAAFDTQHVGTGKPVTLSGLSVALTDGNMAVYGVQFQQALVGNISTAPLLLSAQGDQREYALDSAGRPLTTSRGIPRADGLQGSDSIDHLVQAFDSGQIGTTTLSIQPGYVINDGNAGANYAVSLLSAIGTITAPPADLSTLSYQPTMRSLATLASQQSQSAAVAATSEGDDTRRSDYPTLRQCR